MMCQQRHKRVPSEEEPTAPPPLPDREQTARLLEAADRMGELLQNRHQGFLPNKRQQRMGGLAAIELAQAVKALVIPPPPVPPRVSLSGRHLGLNCNPLRWLPPPLLLSPRVSFSGRHLGLNCNLLRWLPPPPPRASIWGLTATDGKDAPSPPSGCLLSNWFVASFTCGPPRPRVSINIAVCL